MALDALAELFHLRPLGARCRARGGRKRTRRSWSGSAASSLVPRSKRTNADLPTICFNIRLSEHTLEPEVSLTIE
jgi:hypothetical protein